MSDNIDTSNMTVEQMQALSKELKEKLKNETRNVQAEIDENGYLILTIDPNVQGLPDLMNRKGTYYVIASSLGFKSIPDRPELLYSLTVMRKKE